MRNLFTFSILFALWLLMSGIYTPLLITLGVISVALAMVVAARMDAADGDKISFGFSAVRFARYILWLMAEIARSSWAVTKIILSPGMADRQHLFFVPVSPKSDLGQVVFANSITLTPGTITVETEPQQFLVHALNYSDDDVAALADMGGRVAAVESAGNK